MGLKDILTRPILGSGDTLKWSEPLLMRPRLQGDLWIRLVIVLASWVGGCGILLTLFQLNRNPPGIGLAIGLGAVIGFGPACLALFFNKRQVSGTVRVDNRGVTVHRVSAGPLWMVNRWLEFPFGEIDRCVLVDGLDSEQPLDVMILDVEGERFLIGLSSSVDMDQLARHLASGRVAVKRGKKIPEEFLEPLGWLPAVIVGVLGVTLLFTGVIAWSVLGSDGLNRRASDPVPDRRPARQQPLAAPDGLPAFVPGFAGPDDRAGNEPVRGTPSELVGGAGGSPFRKVTDADRPVVGLTLTTGAWEGLQRISSVTPLAKGESPAQGFPAAMARDGYAVGGLHVDGQQLINAVSIIFMKLNADGTLDPSDSYTSDWLGTPHEQAPRTIHGNGRFVIGVHGRAGAVIDAVGLIYR